MSFQWPLALFALLLVPLAIAAYVLLQRRRAQYALRFTNLDLLANVAPKRPGVRRHIPPLLYLLALVVLVIALARPEATVSVPREEATVMMVMDVSRSMNATDVEPNRLDAARTAARAFLEQVPEQFRVGVLAFSNSTDLLAPPSTDRELAEDAISALQPISGTAMGDGIAAGVRAAERGTEGGGNGNRDSGGQGGNRRGDDGGPPPTAILLLSDGASTTGTAEPLQAAELARSEGVPVYAIALGTSAGEVEVPDGLGGTQVINVPPDEETLREVADITGGEFFDAPGADELRQVYEQLGSQLGSDDEKREITVVFAGAGLVLMLIGGALAAVWFNRFP